MNPKRRIALVDRLAKAIGYIGPDFERFGRMFLDCLLELPINHQGVNLVGHPDRYRAGLELPWSKQTEWPAVRNFAAATGIGAENGRDQVAPAWRSVIRVNSEGRPSRSAKPGHSPVPLFTYSVMPSTS
jgi:hypothetical protein